MTTTKIIHTYLCPKKYLGYTAPTISKIPTQPDP